MALDVTRTSDAARATRFQLMRSISTFRFGRRTGFSAANAYWEAFRATRLAEICNGWPVGISRVNEFVQRVCNISLVAAQLRWNHPPMGGFQYEALARRCFIRAIASYPRVVQA